jgi:hypothetical protein
MGSLSSSLTWDLANKIWAATLNPYLSNPFNQMKIIPNIQLINGETTIQHGLGAQMNGWVIVDVQGAATIYRSAPLNGLSLTLTSNAKVLVSLGVF